MYCVPAVFTNDKIHTITMQCLQVSECIMYYCFHGTGGYVFGSVGLSVCLFVANITQKVINGLG